MSDGEVSRKQRRKNKTRTGPEGTPGTLVGSRSRSPVDVTLDGALADGGRGEVLHGAADAGHGGVPVRKGGVST